MRVLLGSSSAGPFDGWGTERPSCGSPWEPQWATEIELLLLGEVVGASSLLADSMIGAFEFNDSKQPCR